MDDEIDDDDEGEGEDDFEGEDEVKTSGASSHDYRKVIKIQTTRVRATGLHYRQMRRKNIFGTKKHYLAKTSGEIKSLLKKIGT